MNDAIETWTTTQAQAFFNAGLIDDYLVLRVNGQWAVGLVMPQGSDKGYTVLLRSAGESNRHKPLTFTTLDAAIETAQRIGFDTSVVGTWVPMGKQLARMAIGTEQTKFDARLR
jgi:hypothetical protein